MREAGYTALALAATGGAAAGLAAAWAAGYLTWRAKPRRVGSIQEHLQHLGSDLEIQLERAKEELAKEKEKRAADRQGRIRAERNLRRAVQKPKDGGRPSNLVREITLSPGEAGDAAETAAAVAQAVAEGTGDSVQARADAYPLRPIGHLESCFRQRNGTPRQPQLVPLARCRLHLASEVPRAALEGLELYSHVWILYVFHANTDIANLWHARGITPKAKVKVPRLNGERLGVLATRTPHRPCPIGLSTARVLHVDVGAGTVLLGGADVVDGSPVLDIKPYVPFCDSLPDATAPEWVTREAEDEPLAIQSVLLGPDEAQALEGAWQQARLRGASLYADFAEFRQFVLQVLGRDIRSLNQRLNGIGSSKPGSSNDVRMYARSHSARRLAASTTPAPGGGGSVFSHTTAASPLSGRADDGAGNGSGESGGSVDRGRSRSASVGVYGADMSPGTTMGEGGALMPEGYYSVCVEGVVVTYDVLEHPRHVMVRSSHPAVDERDSVGESTT